MPVRCGSVVDIGIQVRRADFTIRRASPPGQETFVIYEDAEGTSIGQPELLMRSGAIAMLSRAMTDGSFVAAYGDDADPGRLFRLEVTKELGDDNDLPTKILLSPVVLQPMPPMPKP
jgi:hypothetical protein